MQKPFDVQEILGVGWRLRTKSFLLDDVYSVVWTISCIGQTVLHALSSCSHCGWFSSRCSLLERLSAASQPFIDMFVMTRKTKALCMGRKMHVHIITNPQVFCKRENKWGERCQHIWTLLKSGSLCSLFLMYSFFLAYFPPRMPAP